MPEAEWLCYHRTGIGVPARPGFLLYDISGEKCLAPHIVFISILLPPPIKERFLVMMNPMSFKSQCA